MITAAFENNIFLFLLPPKTTHRLQPLDVLVFAPIQTAWSKRAELHAAQGAPITHATVIAEYMDIRKTSMQAKVIIGSWKCSAHWPINLSLFKDEDYAPSRTTSIFAPYPASYPDKMPRCVVHVCVVIAGTDSDIGNGSNQANSAGNSDVELGEQLHSVLETNTDSSPLLTLEYTNTPLPPCTCAISKKAVNAFISPHSQENFMPAQLAYVIALENKHHGELATQVSEATKARTHAVMNMTFT
jgi:hypothetical protein